ncbi:tRNA pseudouridine(13) synthase TruD [Helicobacter pylori]|uniref:tRNA pseudouridine(13) synthase TruD n=1 Tax=Helicobacter pylori TaxID=210 RepID=UPI002300A024|nr:tRNA pseudouridine(13) synthase TruD [Helicobacter pylori]WCB34864.1 tRNA pseudouridine(13) synthase TruD [Helicobacter pylori]WHT46565.1 tRNA pseudouridine(13) synthase TruD [Helicobacter pylori]
MNLNFMPLLHAYNHASIDFHFNPSARDFCVHEVPLYDFSNTGEHAVIQVRKSGLSTLEMLQIFSQILGVRIAELGYAGLKDKNALTTQFISFPKKYAPLLEKNTSNFQEKNLKILSLNYHHNKIKLGHLKGNRFFMRFKKMTPLNAQKTEQVLEQIAQFGMPNYFGPQRFGKFNDNHQEGLKILQNQTKFAHQKLNAFLISSYQSYLFNSLLSKRLEISKIISAFSVKENLEFFKQKNLNINPNTLKALKNQAHPFKILEGDVMCHYPYGKFFDALELEKESERFLKKEAAPTGLLDGKKALYAKNLSLEIEKEFQHNLLSSHSKTLGSRRFFWVFVENITSQYVKEKAQFELGFYLPKGSYASALLKEIKHEKGENNDEF